MRTKAENMQSRAVWKQSACVAAFVLGIAAAFLSGCGKPPEPPKMPPPAVTVALPLRQTVDVYWDYVGQLASPQTVELRARVDGFVKEINFRDGAEVKQGALLFVIDPAPFEVAVQKAKAQLQLSEAALAQARDMKQIEVTRAAVAKAEALLANMAQLARDNKAAYQAGAVSREAVDAAVMNERQAVATVNSERASLTQAQSDYTHTVARAEASVAADRATLADAELKLGYTRVYAPLSGLIGRAEVKVGSLVQQMQANLLATMSSIDPLWVYFAISEREAFALNKLRVDKKLGQASTGKTNDKLPIQMILEDGSLYPFAGAYDFASPTYDTSTGTLTLRAELPNPERWLRPGNYAKVRMMVTERPDALLVTERAVGTDQGGKFLLVVNAQNVVERRAVTLGVQHNGRVEIESGLKGDERVVVNGLQRARPGAVVDPQLEKAAGAKPDAAANEPTATTKGRP